MLLPLLHLTLFHILPAGNHGFDMGGDAVAGGGHVNMHNDKAKDGNIIYVGNLDVARDFSDVRDTVHAYRILLEKGKRGDIFNVGSGTGYNLKDVLNQIIKKSGKSLKIQIDPKRYRKIDIPEQICDPSKLKSFGINFKRSIF